MLFQLTILFSSFRDFNLLNESVSFLSERKFLNESTFRLVSSQLWKFISAKFSRSSKSSAWNRISLLIIVSLFDSFSLVSYSILVAFFTSLNFKWDSVMASSLSYVFSLLNFDWFLFRVRIKNCLQIYLLTIRKKKITLFWYSNSITYSGTDKFLLNKNHSDCFDLHSQTLCESKKSCFVGIHA